MAARLILQRGAEPPEAVPLPGRALLGGAPEDDLHAPGLPPGALAVWPAPDGVVVEAHAAIPVVSGRPLAEGGRRLVRAGERAEVGGVSLAPCPVEEATRALAGALLAAADAGAPVHGRWLLALEGPHAGERVALDGEPVLGRGPAAGVRLEDPAVSRRHARVVERGGGLWVEDLGSKNGVRVNGRRVRRRGTRLRHGDEVEVGESLFVVVDASAPRGEGATEREGDGVERAAGGSAGSRRWAAWIALVALAVTVLLIAAAL